MTNNQQMLDVLDKLMKKGWKFEVLNVFTFPPHGQDDVGDKDFSFSSGREIYALPTILEAEAVIVKFFGNIEYTYGWVGSENEYCYNTVDENKDNKLYYIQNADRLLAALLMALKLADAELDKFKEIK